jgi:hypothetical protein
MRRRGSKTKDVDAAATTAFAVTLVHDGPPYIEVGAYTYSGNALPAEGDLITITSILNPWGSRPHESQARVSRVDPKAATPISATLAVPDDDQTGG